jgi:hypothetical protein
MELNEELNAGLAILQMKALRAVNGGLGYEASAYDEWKRATRTAAALQSAVGSTSDELHGIRLNARPQ